MGSNSLKIENLFGLQGRVAVITGGGRGLGETLARAWVVNGGHAVITSRTEQTLSKLCQELSECGPGKAEYIVGDLSSKAGCVAVCAEIKRRFKKIHVLVNNAGTFLSAPLDDVPEKGEAIFAVVHYLPMRCFKLTEEIVGLTALGPSQKGGMTCLVGRTSPKNKQTAVVFRPSMENSLIELRVDLNVKAVFYMTSELTPELANGATNLDPGRVIVMSSAAAFNFNTQPLRAFGIEGKGNWSYKASKAGAISLSTNLAVTLGPKFITVNAICPGFYPSTMTQTVFDTIGDSIDKEHPMGRSGTPEDLAGVFLFLASRAGAHVSGNVRISLDFTPVYFDSEIANA